MRLFLAIPIPETIAERIESICRGLPDVRWVPQDQLHITLRFLGDEISESRFEEIVEAMSTVAASAFTLRLRRVGRFFHPRAPQVLWLGVDEEPALLQLHRTIENRLRKLGFAGEKRAFEGHVTLARLKGVSEQRVAEYLNLNVDFEAGLFPVEDFVLYSSVLRPGGALHTIEEVFPLTPAFVPGIRSHDS